MQQAAFKKINTFVFDVDGVFTNSQVLVLENGDLLRSMNTRDGQAVKMALNKGYTVAIITKGLSQGVRIRFENLGIPYIYDRVEQKTDAFDALIATTGKQKDEILYLGDDIPDLAIYPLVGISACPGDAAFDNLQKADYICHHHGGQGCVREVIEKVMRIQDQWNT